MGFRGAAFVVVTTFLIVGVIVGIFTSYWPLVSTYLKTFTGIQIDFRIFFAVATILAELYVVWLVRGFFFRFFPRKERRILVVKPARVHWVLTVIILGLWALFLWMVLHIARAEILSGFSFFETASTIVFAIIGIILIVLVYPIVKHINLLPKQVKTGAAKDTSAPGQKRLLNRRNVLILSAFIYFFVFTFALWYLPANVASGPLPSKPQVVAHRGGSYLGPENTIEAIATALDFNVTGWEVDVRISVDGVPFLMHDEHLWRTTNIGQVFPARAWNLASSFTWAELQQLNAGSWFVTTDPYETIANKIVGEDRVTAYQTAKIPSLTQVVNFTRDHCLILNVDWRSPPTDHPFRDQYFPICYNMIASANFTAGAWIMDLTPSKFATFPSPISKIVLMERGYIISPTVDAFHASGKEIINMPDNFLNIFYRSYQSAGIPLNVYGVNSPWRFSQDWVLGVDYVTTDAPHLFVGMTEPESWMSVEEYYSWVIPICFGGIAIVTIVYLFLRRYFSRKMLPVTAKLATEATF